MIGEIADQLDLGIVDLVIGFGGRDHRVDQGFLRAEHRGLLRGTFECRPVIPGPCLTLGKAGERVAILHRRFIGGSGENLAEHLGIPIDQLAAQTGPLAQKLVDGWLASAGHRRNLLEPVYSHFGLAAAGRGDRLVVVHVFGQRRALLAEPLDLEVPQGARLDLSIAAGDTPQQFAFAPPGTPPEALVTLEPSSSEVSVAPGEYRLKFFFPAEREGYFQIVDGPLLVVT